MWETKFWGHLPKNRCPLYVLYKIPLARANFLLTQLKMHSHWRAGKRLILLYGFKGILAKLSLKLEQVWVIESHKTTGRWFNIKMSSYQYRKSHCGHETILRPSNGISSTGKMTSLYRWTVLYIDGLLLFIATKVNQAYIYGNTSIW